MTPAPVAFQADPLRSVGFAIEVEGMQQALFRECSGLSGQLEVTRVEEGGAAVPHQLPGRVMFGNLTLKQGMTDSSDLYQWFLDVASGKAKRKTVTLKLLSQKMETVRQWTLLQAFPVKWTGPAVQAGATEIAVESLELAHEGVLL